MLIGYLTVAKYYNNYYVYSLDAVLFLFIAFIIIFGIINTENLTKVYQRVLAVIVSVAIGILSVLSDESVKVVLFYFYIVEASLFYPVKHAKIFNIMTIITFIIAVLFAYDNNLLHAIRALLHTSLLIIIAVLCRAYAEAVSAAVSNHSLAQQLEDLEKRYQEMSCLAQKDGLTDLYNYRTFADYINNVDIKGLAIILIDVDFFKTFNDTYGHLCGDAILREIARLIKQSVRDNDMVFRYGGEEFAVVLNINNMNELKSIADRIARSVRLNDFKYNGESVGTLTVSVGYAAATSNTHTARELILAADMALYKAKANGRDTVCCYKEIMC